ncbi:hypothetical protein E1264_11810 [Actinomadura sp. KC216]|uniref:hypothetical protein n=1 Tax=Actinomadura sp. KC216 TaxID=2530370 RepID=UPI0010433E78|nr:hypothetical protein [Actinomadura sp. KC216]TDB88360.1 hypothetical protein E1264_11810 [Actinomadura sp. KC216]
MPSTWKFVDRPEEVHSTLLDMNDGADWRTSSEDFNISPPPVNRSLVRNALIDGGILTAASYDLRELQFTVRLHGETEAQRVSQLKAFEKELAKPANLLMYQSQLHDRPVFFRTLRSDSFELDTQFVPGSVWQIKASIAAEPYAIGIRRDLAPIAVANDPAAVTNPTRFDIQGIVGDGPTPAFVRIDDLGDETTIVLAQRTINNPTALTNWVQAESGTMGVDTATFNAPATFSGTPNRGTRTTFATNNLVSRRITVTVPTASSSEALRGRYRVFVRASVDAAADDSTFLMRWERFGPAFAPGPTVTVTIPNGEFRLVDLGILEVPTATTAPSSIGYSALPPGFVDEELAIHASRIAGTGALDLDYVYLMPADERLCSVQQVRANGFLILDGPNDSTYGMAAGSTPFGLVRTIDNGGGLVPRIGGLPMLVPGVSNRWYLLTSRALSDTRTVEISYWPRWLDVATA